MALMLWLMIIIFLLEYYVDYPNQGSRDVAEILSKAQSVGPTHIY